MKPGNRHVYQLIEKAEHILLCTDERIDGDTIGSTLGMYHLLSALQKQVSVYSPRELDQTLAFLPGVEVIVRDEAIFDDKSIDLAMIFDCSDGLYVKPYFARLPKTTPTVVFDHHETNPHFGDMNLIEKDAASTADVVYRFARDGKLPMNREAAQCFLTGIVTDTSAFSNAGTTPDALKAAQELMSYGAKLPHIIRETMMKKSLNTLKLWGTAFERLHRSEEFDALLTAVTRKDLENLGATEDDARAISNFLSAMLEDADTVIVLRETADGGVKASLRSDKRNVAELAKRFGGGGHAAAAGFLVENASLAEENGKWMIQKRDLRV